MIIQEYTALSPYTTLKIGGPARFFCVVEREGEVLEAVNFAKEKGVPVFVLGGGSNMVVGDGGFEGLVIQVNNKGVEAQEAGGGVLLKVQAGEVWDEVVEFAAERGYWGMENLSHIPGRTGAVVVQNVGAYGQEAKDIVEYVKAFSLEDGKERWFKNRNCDKGTNLSPALPSRGEGEMADCNFSYRSSIFNTTEKSKYLIWEIGFRLRLNGQPSLSYRDLRIKYEGKNPSLQEIRQTVTEIRDTKFPFPVEAKNGNVGSFFKNSFLTLDEYKSLLSRLGKVLGKDAFDRLESKKIVENQRIKIPSAFLIDICGLKGIAMGGAAINHNQPLVILNASGAATSSDIINLATHVQQIVFQKTGVLLKAEPEFLGIDPGSLK